MGLTMRLVHLQPDAAVPLTGSNVILAVGQKKPVDRPLSPTAVARSICLLQQFWAIPGQSVFGLADAVKHVVKPTFCSATTRTPYHPDQHRADR